MSHEISAGDMIVDSAYHSSTISRCDDVFLNAHQNLRLSTSFF